MIAWIRCKVTNISPCTQFPHEPYCSQSSQHNSLPLFDIQQTFSSIMLQFPYLSPHSIYSVSDLLIKTQGNGKRGRRKNLEIEEIRVKSQRQEKDGSCLSLQQCRLGRKGCVRALLDVCICAWLYVCVFACYILAYFLFPLLTLHFPSQRPGAPR